MDILIYLVAAILLVPLVVMVGRLIIYFLRQWSMPRRKGLGPKGDWLYYSAFAVIHRLHMAYNDHKITHQSASARFNRVVRWAEKKIAAGQFQSDADLWHCDVDMHTAFFKGMFRERKVPWMEWNLR